MTEIDDKLLAKLQWAQKILLSMEGTMPIEGMKYTELDKITPQVDCNPIKKDINLRGVKTLVWDKENQSIRGSFVNLILTLTILGLIVAGVTDDDIMERVEKLTALILGFFATSIGVWTYKKVVETKKEGSE